MILKNREIDLRPWGKFERFTANEKTTVKIIDVYRFSKLSTQKHKLRDEFWQIISGTAYVLLGTEWYKVKAGMNIKIPKNTIHSIRTGWSKCKFLEISFGKFKEDDIERLEDEYGRCEDE